MNWKAKAKKEIFKSRDSLLLEMKQLSNKLDKCNSDINKLEKQLNCDHGAMETKYKAAAFGGFDIDVCVCCGYEYTY